MKMTANPLVSVCIPVYNGQEFIKDCISSVIHQNYENSILVNYLNAFYKHNKVFHPFYTLELV